jgi:fatty-acyl-CoA synthase
MTPLTSAYWTADTSVALDDRPIGAILRERATRAPDRPALQWTIGDEIVTTSYAGLLLQTTAAAQRLLAHAGERGRVAIMAAGSPDWVVIEYAAALAGVALVPIDPAVTDAQLEQILSVVTVGLLLCDDEYDRSPLLERAQALAEKRRLRRTPVVHLLAAWPELAGDGTDLPTVDASDPFLVQPTSALTGRAGAVVLSHRAAYNSGFLQMRHLGATADDCWFNLASLHDVAGSVGGVLAMLSIGGAVALAAETDAGAILRALELTRATVVGRVPTVPIELVEHPDLARTDTSRVRAVVTGAAAVPTSVVRRVEEAVGAVVVKAYDHAGAPAAFMTSPDDDVVTKAETIGRTLPQHDSCIVRMSGTTAGCGEDGELLIRSLMTMDSYVGDMVGTQPAIDAEGWLHTGDRGSMDERGVVRIRGRRSR